ncbi:hypothetical protein [Liquorilactobacillus hordei]|uniref:hypothetical protein n=1 Tax=Liquorilactobacillus hordei TaxID=468911 RepID=UPI0039ED936C
MGKEGINKLDMKFIDALNKTRLSKEDKREQYEILHRAKRQEGVKFSGKFGKVPISMFDDKNIRSQSLALYTYLSAIAHGWLYLDFSSKVIAGRFGLSKFMKKEIDGYFQELVDNGYIKIVKKWFKGKSEFYDLSFEDYSKDFFKVYTEDMYNIVVGLQSPKVFSVIAAYAAIKSTLYEDKGHLNEEAGIVYASAALLEERSKLSSGTFFTARKWLTDNCIISTIKANLSHKQGVKKNYYSLYNEAYELERFMIRAWIDDRVNYILDGVIVKKPEKVDQEILEMLV